MAASEALAIVKIYVEVRPNGSVFTGRCPVCRERGESFSYDSEDQMWSCDACGDGGDIIGLVQSIRKCSRDFAERFVSRLNAANQQRSDRALEARARSRFTVRREPAPRPTKSAAMAIVKTEQLIARRRRRAEGRSEIEVPA